MARCMNTSKKIWMDRSLVPWEKARVHILTHTLHYGCGVFEGIRCYETKKGPAVFRLKDHVKRLFNSARLVGMKIPYSEREIYNAVLQTVSANKLKECYIRPIVYYGYGQMGLNPIGAKVNVGIAAWKWGAYLGQDGIINGVRIKISPWRRHSPKAMPVEAKVCGAYVNSILTKVDAVNTGYGEAVMLDEKGYVAEATGENIFIVKKGVLITPPRGNILLGITRASILEIAKGESIKTAERRITKKQLYNADEAFLTGTAAEVTPIREVDGRKLGSGKPGAITKQLQSAFYKAIHGKLPRYEKWLDYVAKAAD